MKIGKFYGEKHIFLAKDMHLWNHRSRDESHSTALLGAYSLKRIFTLILFLGSSKGLWNFQTQKGR